MVVVINIETLLGFVAVAYFVGVVTPVAIYFRKKRSHG